MRKFMNKKKHYETNLLLLFFDIFIIKICFLQFSDFFKLAKQ